ncbi:hypothetical protein BGZ70_009855 [Mortierella alpina]|uniref:Inhibitor I9 domain-containing protein n=1 Tax=Mortierella alpina TaxID=64518 RepID=A0A9P6J0K5_MORAP|nr:hypothetical protein BGZ70_009855 [Mortierella alpina]
MSSNSHNDGHNALANAVKGSVLPVATKTPGANTAHSLATPAKSDEAKASGVNKVIVVFKDNTPASEIANAASEIESQGGKITHRYETALLGFAAEMPDSAVQTMSVHPHVSYVEADGQVSAYAKKLMDK